MIDVKRIENELNSLPDGGIVLIETNVENASDINPTLIRILTEKNLKGIVISASRPYTNLLSLYEKSDIKIANIFFLDCVSQSKDSPQKKASNVLFLENISDLTHILISVDETIKKRKDIRFILIDSINTMLIHNKPEIFARFVHSLMTKMRLKSINGLLIAFEDEANKEVRAEIAQLCDKVIKV